MAANTLSTIPKDLENFYNKLFFIRSPERMNRLSLLTQDERQFIRETIGVLAGTKEINDCESFKPKDITNLMLIIDSVIDGKSDRKLPTGIEKGWKAFHMTFRTALDGYWDGAAIGSAQLKKEIEALFNSHWRW